MILRGEGSRMWSRRDFSLAPPRHLPAQEIVRTLCSDTQNRRSIKIQKPTRYAGRLLYFSGAGGIRTLVQTWYKVSFLHAYLLFNCREGEGQPLTCTVFLRCFVSSGCRTSNQTSFVFRCPNCRSNETENRRDKSYANSKLGS